MKLFYITTAGIPTEKARGLQIVKMCEAFQRQGIQVELVIPIRFPLRRIKQLHKVWAFYDVDTPFLIKRLFVPIFVKFGGILSSKIRRYLYHFQCFIFSIFALFVTLFEGQGVYYTRVLETLFLLCLTKPLHRKKIYFEAHEFHGEQTRRDLFGKFNCLLMCWMLRHIDGLIVITGRLQMLYSSLGIHEQHVLLAPDGLDEKRLWLPIDKTEARQRLDISLDKKIICYTGHLFQWKGVYTLAESSKYLSEHYVIYIVGGIEPDIHALRTFLAEHGLKNIVTTGYIPYREVPVYLAASDVLVLPNTAKKRIAREYTSPLKLFEYMGARRPIVASDLSSLREILRHKENAYLVPPDDPKTLADGIVALMENEQLAEYIIETAFKDVRNYTWDHRAKAILQFFNREYSCTINR